MNFYNCFMKHIITEEISKHVMDNYNDKSLMKKVVIANENSRKWHLERYEHNQCDVVLLTNWILEFNIKKFYFKRKKSKKGTKHQRTERNDIEGVVTKAKFQIFYARIIEIINERKDIEAQQEIRESYSCFIMLKFFN